jgi:hypothetical protein
MLRIAGFENLCPTIQRFPDKYAGGHTFTEAYDSQLTYFLPYLSLFARDLQNLGRMALVS